MVEENALFSRHQALVQLRTAQNEPTGSILIITTTTAEMNAVRAGKGAI